MTPAKKTVAAAATDTLKVIDEAVATSKQTVETVVKAGVKAGTEATTKGVEKAVAITREQVDAAVQAGDHALAHYTDLLSFSKDSVEAAVTSGTILVKGIQDVVKTVLGLTQASVEQSLAHTKAVSAVKSVHELVELNQGFAKASLDKAMTESVKLSEMAFKVVEEAAAPLQGRLEAAVSKALKPVAA